MEFEKYRHLQITRREDHVTVIDIAPRDVEPGGASAHAELAHIWTDVAADAHTHVAVVTGTFGSTVDPHGMLRVSGNYDAVTTVLRQGLDIVHNLVNCDKPVVSAIAGSASGAGMVVGLLADISVVAHDAVLMDGHVGRVGVAAGDHATMIWPLLCGMAKAKYYLLASEALDGREAERIGLVSRSVPAEQVLPEALRIAERLASSAQLALRWTKRSLNHWLRDATPVFEASIAFEALSVLGPDHHEAIAALVDHRQPVFGTGQEW